MRLCLVILAALLTGCGNERVVTVYTVPHVPADLRKPVSVVCPRGYEEEDLAICLLRTDAGLNKANGKIVATDTILTQAEQKQ